MTMRQELKDKLMELRLKGMTDQLDTVMEDAAQLSLAAEVGFKFRENPQHIQKGFPGRALRIDRLFGRPEGDAPFLTKTVRRHR